MLLNRPGNRQRQTIPCIVMRMAYAKREWRVKKMIVSGLTYSEALKTASRLKTLTGGKLRGSCGFQSALALSVFALASLNAVVIITVVVIMEVTMEVTMEAIIEIFMVITITEGILRRDNID